MKLKNTVNGAELELIGNDWTLVPAQPPEHWLDVTEKCEPDEYANTYGRFISIIYDSTRNVLAQHNDTYPGVYRLRKVRVFDEHGQNLLNRWAFIVERKIP